MKKDKKKVQTSINVVFQTLATVYRPVILRDYVTMVSVLFKCIALILGVIRQAGKEKGFKVLFKFLHDPLTLTSQFTRRQDEHDVYGIECVQ